MLMKFICLKCIIGQFDICLFQICRTVALGFSHKQWTFHCEKFGKANTVFRSLWQCRWGTKFKCRQKAGSDKAFRSMWKIKVSDKEKSMHSLYTSQHPRTFFSLPLSVFFFFSMKVFHTEDTHLRSGREPPDTMTAKVHLINS